MTDHTKSGATQPYQTTRAAQDAAMTTHRAPSVDEVYAVALAAQNKALAAILPGPGGRK